MSTRVAEPMSRAVDLTGFLTLLGYLVALLVFVGAALPVYSVEQRLLAWVVFVLGVSPIVAFLRRPEGAPLLELVLAEYVVLFALPVFFQQDLLTFRFGPRVPAADAITTTLFAAVLAVAALRVGNALAPRVIRVRLQDDAFRTTPLRLFALGVFTAGGAICMNLGLVQVPGQFMQLLVVVFSADLGVALLGLLYHGGRLSHTQGLVARALLVALVAIGLAIGMAQLVLQPVLIWILSRWIMRRRGPKLLAVGLVAAFFLLQPVKGAYRNALWRGASDYSFSAKLELVRDLTLDHWRDISGDPVRLAAEVRRSAAERLSLLMSTAHYVELTPQYGFRHGATLGYMIYGWIPRFVWPGKPIAQEANRTLPVEYGIQSTLSTRTTVFGVGHLAEGYINFGIAGIIPLFLVIGAIYRLPWMVVRNSRAIGAAAVVLAATANMMWVESTIAHVFGGILQQLVVQVILLRLFARVGAEPRPAGAGVPPASTPAPRSTALAVPRAG